ncbi:MAG: cytochrome c biogenesis protein ResB [Planctomycetota bacterium]
MTATASPPGAPAKAALRPPVAAAGPLRRVTDVLASMKLTVVLLLLFGLLTFAGTLAQQYAGIYVVQRDYFESFWVVWDTHWQWADGRTLRVPMPGGYLIMLTLFVNLMVGGVMRMRWQARNAGILITHFGMAFLLVAGFVKLHFSYSGYVTMFEGRSSSTMVSFHESELALLRRDGNDVVERTIHEHALAGAHDGVVTIDDPQLPFVLRVSHWFDNCRPRQKGPMFDVDQPVVTDAAGVEAYLQPVKVEPERERNYPGCYVSVTPRQPTGDGAGELRGMVWGYEYRPEFEWRAPFTFEAGGHTWGLDLRRVTWDLPFTVRLDKFEKRDHPGTMRPSDFSSWVTVIEDGRELPVHIYMNHPLRRDGLVFFQTNWGPQPQSGMSGPPWYSLFEVANNPSDAWPRWASYVVFLGLLAHFLPKLIRYLLSSGRRATLPEMS